MADEKKNHFILNKVFPKTDVILSRKKKTIDDIFKDALFVLDTNSLLAPYQTGKEDLEKIRSAYEKLINENRLFVPEHVLREFAKNRSLKISELYSNIDKTLSSTLSIQSFEYPILGELDSYKKLKDVRNKIQEHLKEYKECLKELKSGITNWNWSDPVTVMYSKTFNQKTVINTQLNEDELIKQYDDRLSNNIPPGNKDASKDTNAIGDFVIWQSIIELGKSKKKDVIFISNDEKNDWLLKGNKQSISTKFELVDEFWRHTNGKNFICMTFSNFLELQGLDIDVADDFVFDVSEFDAIFKSANIKSFATSETKSNQEKYIGSLEALERIYVAIKNFLNDFDTENESIFLEQSINVDIKHFCKTYRGEFYSTDSWNEYFDYLFLFDEWLKKIRSYNDEIIYQEHRQKRDTRTQKILLTSLCKEFVKKYEEFVQII